MRSAAGLNISAPDCASHSQKQHSAMMANVQVDRISAFYLDDVEEADVLEKLL
jgi:hypothetical protein